MSGRERVVAEAAGRKQHCCVGCGGTFSYWLQRKGAAEGSDAAFARTVAQRLANESLADAIETHPCPHCGLVQPEMLAARQLQWFLAALAILAVGVGLGMGLAAARAIGMQQGAWLALAGAVGAGWAAQYAASFRLNEDLEANRIQARQEMAVAKLYAGDDGDPAATIPPSLLRPRPTEYAAGVGMCLAAAAVSSAPTFAPLFMGWLVNDYGVPSVVGPGETVAIDVPGRPGWNEASLGASAVAEVSNAVDLKMPAGALLFASPYGAYLSKKTRSGWGLLGPYAPGGAEVRLPADPALVGAELELEVTVRCRVRKGFLPGDEAERTRRVSAKVRLSEAGAGRKFEQTFYGGLIAALAVGGLGCGLLATAAWQMRWKGVGRTEILHRSPPPLPPPPPTSLDEEEGEGGRSP